MEGIVRTVLVDAKEPWNHSGVTLQPGCTYKFEVEKPVEEWKDRGLEATPEKEVLEPTTFQNLFKPLRRVKEENWLVLIGSIGKNKRSFFKIGEGRKHTVPAEIKAGELLCFANDARGFYSNNSGKLKIKITLIDG